MNDGVYNENPVFDIMSSNVYDINASPTWAGFYGKYVSNIICNIDDLKCYFRDHDGPTVAKPVIFAESGVERVAERCPYEGIERTRSLWYSLFSGVSILPWSLRFDDNMYTNFARLRYVIDHVDLNENYWHPGATKPLTNVDWKYEAGYAERMYDSEFKTDMTYLRSGDKKRAIGMATNKTFNAKNSSNCDSIDVGWAYESGAVYMIPQIVQTGDDNLKVKGLDNGHYLIRFYYPSNLLYPFQETSYHTLFDNDIPLEVTMYPTSSEYIVIFEICKEGSDFLLPEGSFITEGEITSEKNYTAYREKERLALDDKSKELFEEISLFPNPANQEVTILLSNSTNYLAVEIFDIQGKSREIRSDKFEKYHRYLLYGARLLSS